MSTAPASSFTPGLVLMHRYRLDAALAPGSMAEVWNGHDLVLKRPVAIKLLHPHLAEDPALVERFRREAISAARLGHPNIVPTYDAGTFDDIAYIILGLVHGPSLHEVLSNTRIDIDDALMIAKQVADAASCAHESGIVHRDLNPHNVFVSGEDRRVLVTDFGLAKAVAESTDESLSLAGFQMGNGAFHAPEQKSGDAVDARADVFAIGSLLQEMLGYAAGDAATIVEKATAASPDDRYQTAVELPDALQALLTKHGSMPVPSEKQSQKLPPPKPPRQKQPQPQSQPQGGMLETGVPGEDEITAPHTHLNTGQYQATGVVPAQPQAGEQSQGQPHVDPGSGDTGNLIKTVSLSVAALLLFVAITIGIAINRSSSGDDQTTTETTSVQPIALTSARAFDPPPGDGGENDAQAANAFDGDPATAWSTQSYASSTFGNLKTGVGLVLVGAPQNLRSLEVQSNGQGWNAQIYVASAIPLTLGGWGDVVDNQSGLGQSATFDLHNTSGSTILIWITDLGEANRLAINEVTINS